MAKRIPYEESHRLNDNGELEKKCSKHNVYFPEADPWMPCTEEYFNINQTNTKDGFNSSCRKCASKTVIKIMLKL